MPHKAPGKYWREGLSLVEIIRMFPDDAAAERWFVQTRWPDGVHCPKCGSTSVRHRPNGRSAPYRCSDCRRGFSAKTDSLMHGSHLSYQTWAVAIYLMTTGLKGTSSMKLHRDLGVTQKTAWYLAHRIRENFADACEPFEGPVEVDETFVGGKRRNMALSRRRHVDPRRGLADKEIVLAAKDRATNRVVTRHVARRDVPTIRAFVCETTAPGATIYSDEWHAYEKAGRRHAKVLHSIKQYVDDQIHTNGVESFWSMLKRGHKGVYHKMSAKHLRRYAAEFAGRHNDRCVNTIEQMRRIARRMVGRRLTFKALTA